MTKTDIFHIGLALFFIWSLRYIGLFLDYAVKARKENEQRRLQAERAYYQAIHEAYQAQQRHERARQQRQRAEESASFSNAPNAPPSADSKLEVKRKIQRLLALANRPGTPAEGENALRHAKLLAEKNHLVINIKTVRKSRT